MHKAVIIVIIVTAAVVFFLMGYLPALSEREVDDVRVVYPEIRA